MKHGWLKNKIVVASVLCLSGIAYADDIPFDPNVPDPSPAVPQAAGPATGAADEFQTPTTGQAPTAEELKTPPELEIPLTPVPKPADQKAADNGKNTAPAELSGLGDLTSFGDVAVISKRYLPKTNRLEFFPNFGLVLNDSFFNDIIFGGRLAYYFSEQYGLEIDAFSVASSNKQVTNELANRGVGTQSLASPTSYYGLDFKWVPIYGKFGWLDKTIVPFDLYFVGGGGVTGTNQSTTPPTLHIGLGQMFAIKKWMAFRWDVSWYGYQTSTTVTNKPNGTYTNVHATIGMSFFFPGAGYR